MFSIDDATAQARTLQDRAAASRRLRATGLMLFAALAWGSGNVSQKMILDHLDPLAANGITCLVGVVVLLPLVRREGHMATDSPPGRVGLLLKVALAFTLAATLMQVGYGYTTVTNAGFLVNTAAVLTPLLVWVIYRQRPAFWVWPASACSMLGVFLMGGGGMSTLALGDVLSLCAAAAFAVWTLLVGQFMARHRRPALLTAVQLLVCGVVCVLSGAVVYGMPSQQALWAALPEILYLGLVSKGLAYAVMATAQQHVSPTCAAVLVSAEAVFGALAAGLFLGESLGWLRILGSGFIILGVTIAALMPARIEIPPPD